MINPTYQQTKQNRLPDPPKRPKFRSLANLKKAIISIPYFLAGGPEVDADDAALKASVCDPDTVAVLLKPLTLRNYLDFEKQFGEGIELYLYKIFHIIQATATNLSEKDPEKQVTIKMENGIIHTPFGEMYGSLSTNIINLCSYILSCGGRIVGVNDRNGEFETEKIDMDEIIDLLEPDAFFKMNQSNDFNPFYEILNVSNVWNVDEVEEELKDAGEVSSEEVKDIANFPQRIDAESLLSEPQPPNESE